jgi:endonuclease/exonuclease/phosphatase family metal-dependent hydrolase
VSVPGGSIAVKRGYLAVDLTVKGQTYRVFNTHLEQRLLAEGLPETRLIQVGQAQELLSATWAPMSAGRKLIVVGDINSAPDDTIPGVPTPYQLFTLVGGFTDTWTMRPQGGEGLSCCQSESLTNRTSELYERIDMIFSLARPSRVVDMKLLGVTMGDKTRPPGRDGLWPSDHAAVAAKLFFD